MILLLDIYNPFTSPAWLMSHGGGGDVTPITTQKFAYPPYQEKLSSQQIFIPAPTPPSLNNSFYVISQ